MDAAELRRSFWTDAAKSGGVIGLVYVIFFFAGVQITTPWIASMLSWAAFFVIGYFIFYFGRQRSAKYGSAGFTYGQSIGYILVMLLFAAIIVGLAQLIHMEMIAPETYEELKRSVMDNMPAIYDPDSEQWDMMERMVDGNLLWIFTAAMRVFFLGAVIGLFASAFIKRKPDIFAEDNGFNG